MGLIGYSSVRCLEEYLHPRGRSLRDPSYSESLPSPFTISQTLLLKLFALSKNQDNIYPKVLGLCKVTKLVYSRKHLYLSGATCVMSFPKGPFLLSLRTHLMFQGWFVPKTRALFGGEEDLASAVRVMALREGPKVRQ